MRSHTLLESLCTSPVPGVPGKTKEEDEDGYALFKNVCRNVVLFTGSYRFLDEDLPSLLNIMRVPGGRSVPPELRNKVMARVQAGPDDPRMRLDYVLEGKAGFFALGAHAAIQWEQVTRMMHLHVLRAARFCKGPRALCNTDAGLPDLRCEKKEEEEPTVASTGQLIYYFQAVDRFKHVQPRDIHLKALHFVKLSQSANLHGVVPVFPGMRCRLTKKVLAPELVQEATGEVVGIAFHPEERFGDPASSNLRPADTHSCWQRGWVLCDRLPLHVEMRFDGCSEDYTGLGKPGVWYLSPQQVAWNLPMDEVATIDHPGALRTKTIKLTSRKHRTVEVWRCQLPLTHEDDMTFQNAQGKTIRGAEEHDANGKAVREPKGFVVDLYKPPSMMVDEYYQHVYMILGRARKLDWLILRNFPRSADGEPDWSIFEQGPPQYLCEFIQALQSRARATFPRLLHAQRQLGLPEWEQIKPCPPDPNAEGRYLYIPTDRGFRTRNANSASSSSAGQTPARLRKRKGNVALGTSTTDVADEAAGPSQKARSKGFAANARGGAATRIGRRKPAPWARAASAPA